MSGERGFSLFELVAILALIGLVAAIAIPSMSAALDRNRVFSGANLVAAQVRAARLAAISRNERVRIRFDCPAAGAVRVLAVTGDATVDEAGNRCDTTIANDGPIVYMAAGVTFGDVPTLEINGRGQVSAGATPMPLSITVSHDSIARTLVVSQIGRITLAGS